MKNDTLTTTRIPQVIESYFHASNANDIDALVECFSPDASVADEKETHHGKAGIKSWAINVRKKYEFKAEVLRAAQTEMWKQKQWQSPYYWAAFTMQGEWR